METFFQLLTHTPKWVFVLFFSLMFISFKASRTRTIPIWKLFIMPTVTTYFSFSLLISLNLSSLSLAVFLLAVLMGGGLGSFQVSRATLKFDHEKRLVEVPGTWSVFVVFFIIFGSKYYFNYQLALDPAVAQQILFEMTMILISGMTMGFSLGKLGFFLYKMKKGPSVSLMKS